MTTISILMTKKRKILKLKKRIKRMILKEMTGTSTPKAKLATLRRRKLQKMTTISTSMMISLQKVKMKKRSQKKMNLRQKNYWKMAVLKMKGLKILAKKAYRTTRRAKYSRLRTIVTSLKCLKRKKIRVKRILIF